MGGYKCLCGFCPTRVSHKSFCAKCPNKPPDYVNPAREQILAAKAKYTASDLGQATQARYCASDLRQASQAAYQPAYKAKYRDNIAKELREQAEAWQKEHGNGREALDDQAAEAEVSTTLLKDLSSCMRAKRLTSASDPPFPSCV
jgi:hypothetical protein